VVVYEDERVQAQACHAHMGNGSMQSRMMICNTIQVRNQDNHSFRGLRNVDSAGKRLLRVMEEMPIPILIFRHGAIRFIDTNALS
jgi:hypothetical protein